MGWGNKFPDMKNDPSYLEGRLSNAETSLAQKATQLGDVTNIKSKTFQVGDRFTSSLYGGSTWVVQSSVTIEGYSINFDDELHIVVNLYGGGTGIAECQLSSVMDYAKRINISKYAETFSRLKRRQTVTIACKGDSITYGQNNGAGGIDRSGQPTNYGDGSTFDTNKQDPNPYPSVLQTTLNTIYGASVTTVGNYGYPGDQVGNSYTRHRINTSATMTTIFLGVNDMLYATSNGVNPNNVVDPTNRWCITNFVDAYRKYIVREMLRGSSVVLIAPYKFSGYSTFDGSTYSGAKLIQLYKNAILALGKEFNVPVVDFEDFIGGFVDGVMLSGVHPTSAGYDVLGKRLSALFIGNGYHFSDRIIGERQITAIAFGENLVWSGSTGDNKTGVNNANSFQYAYPASGQSYDYFVSSGQDLYYSFYLEKDFMMVMPLGQVQANASFEYSLDHGLTQPEYKLDVLDTQSQNDRSVPSGVITLAPTALKYINSPQDITSHLIIAGRGWHTLRLRSNSGTFTFNGIRFFDYTAFETSQIFGDIGYLKPLTLASGITSMGAVAPSYKVAGGVVTFKGTLVNNNYTVETLLFTMPSEITTIPNFYNGKIFTLDGSYVQLKYNNTDKGVYWEPNSGPAGGANTVNLAQLRFYLSYV